MTFMEALKNARHKDTLVSEDGFECYVEHVGGRNYALSFGVTGYEGTPTWVPVGELFGEWKLVRRKR